MENIVYNKIDENTVEVIITTSVVTTNVLSLNDLNYERESLVKTQAANIEDATARNNGIQVMIDELDAKIAKFQKLGVSVKPDIIESNDPSLAITTS